MNRIEHEKYVKDNDYFDKLINKSGRKKNILVDNENGTVSDQESGLMWQKSGSNDRMLFEQTQDYVDEQNNNRFGGYSNWRLPTLKELSALLVYKKKINGIKKYRMFKLYLDNVFNANIDTCWTQTLSNDPDLVWTVNFLYGYSKEADYVFRNHAILVRTMSRHEKA